jgi:hypothetical protein
MAAVTGCAGLIGGSSRPAKAVAEPHFVRVSTPDGQTSFKYPDAAPGCRHRDAAVHADTHRVIVVQDCQRATPPVNRIIEFSLDRPDAPPRILYQGYGRDLRLPAWSTDGRRIAFMEMGDLVACAADCQMTFRTRIPATDGRWTALAWELDRRRVLLRAEHPDRLTTIVAVEPDSGFTETLAERLDAAALNRWMAEPANGPAARTLFGSSERL